MKVEQTEIGIQTKAIVLRDSLQSFAELMEKRLIKNDHKKHWSMCETEYINTMLIKNFEELIIAYNNHEKYLVVEKCADIANYCMMLAENILVNTEEK